jgi:hypothetical protein
MVRNTEGLNELIERTRDIPMSPERLRAQRSSFAFGNLNIENPNVTREVIARADADFDRIFGSDRLNVGEIAEQRLGRTS